MHMIDLQLRPDHLVRHAQVQGHNHAHDEDLGYAIHSWLTDALGEFAPRTFRPMEQRNGSLRLLGYGKADADMLREHVQLFATPQAMAVCDWDSAASKPIGDITWRQGQTLGFEVRICPIVRGKLGERDAFLAQLPSSGEPTVHSRTSVYRDWLSSRLNGAASLDDDTFNLKAFRLVSTWRQGRSADTRNRAGRRVVRPDALLSGRLTVRDPDAFRTLLHNGIGRHRAFGFGMLLLRPA
ncbi:type I-E CRISPR-associated protein Cas6/Cse3/CasE [Salinisphaera sp. PC39]|uniref:type I-E CRISPR-associated protein Cas6/Cse3/CasE n=1 Tax=Salinisphaera sp. PC39 TaxID=1304156 RepID=UPI003342AD40